MIDKELKIWAAGFFDGEGSALIERVKNTFQLTVCVATTDPGISEDIISSWGGHYRRSQNMSKYDENSSSMDYTVMFNRDEAKKFLLDIFPYLRVKRKEVNIVLRALCVLPKQGGKHGTEAKRAPRGSLRALEPFYEELQSLRSEKKI